MMHFFIYFSTYAAGLEGCASPFWTNGGLRPRRSRCRERHALLEDRGGLWLPPFERRGLAAGGAFWNRFGLKKSQWHIVTWFLNCKISDFVEKPEILLLLGHFISFFFATAVGSYFPGAKATGVQIRWADRSTHQGRKAGACQHRSGVAPSGAVAA